MRNIITILILFMLNILGILALISNLYSKEFVVINNTKHLLINGDTIECIIITLMINLVAVLILKKK